MARSVHSLTIPNAPGPVTKVGLTFQPKSIVIVAAAGSTGERSFGGGDVGNQLAIGQSISGGSQQIYPAPGQVISLPAAPCDVSLASFNADGYTLTVINAPDPPLSVLVEVQD